MSDERISRRNQVMMEAQERAAAARARALAGSGGAPPGSPGGSGGGSYTSGYSSTGGTGGYAPPGSTGGGMPGMGPGAFDMYEPSSPGEALAQASGNPNRLSYDPAPGGVMDTIKGIPGRVAGGIGDMIGWDEMDPEHKALIISQVLGQGINLYSEHQRGRKEDEEEKRERERDRQAAELLNPVLNDYLAR